MSSRRHQTTNSSSSVQLAFQSNPTPHHCGYCNTDGNCTAGLCLMTSIILRNIHSSHCGYCQLKNGKLSFGNKKRKI